ncbi:los glycosyltransferase 5 [Perilla frutescens var. hirtella]|uniref:Los glycosyltransferase 5 n=1 Tax=Perilla frutescens var. hirtella TaxID=608512 RepID=A0AAD4NXY0_PERFH|nr:los glycosyltransferase 5 [Perilla frutescens var. hirtella]
MRLTAEYFALKHEDRELPNKHKLQDPHLYHFAVFSDNVLACAVVVNSTISTAMFKVEDKIVMSAWQIESWVRSTLEMPNTADVAAGDDFDVGE